MNKNLPNTNNSKNSDQIQKQYDEIIRLVKIKIKSKSDLVKLVNKKLKLKIPKATSYYNLIEQIINSENETKFAKKIFGFSSFDEIIEKELIRDGLSVFSKETAVIIADNLSQNKKKWKYTKSNLGDLITNLVSHTNLKHYEKLFPELIQKDLISNLIQHRRAIIGPLGITRSVIIRGDYDADDLIKLLSTYLTEETAIHFSNNAKFISSYLLNNKKYSLDEIRQLILTYGTDDDIKNLFTVLIENQFIQIDGEEDSSIGIITPHGIIGSGRF